MTRSLSVLAIKEKGDFDVLITENLLIPARLGRMVSPGPYERFTETIGPCRKPRIGACFSVCPAVIWRMSDYTATIGTTNGEFDRTLSPMATENVSCI